EIRRVMLARGAPLAMPAPEEPQTPAAGARPNAGGPAPRPVAGPVVPLTSQPTGSESLLGTGPGRPPGSDPLVNRVLVEGEAVPAVIRTKPRAAGWSIPSGIRRPRAPLGGLRE